TPGLLLQIRLQGEGHRDRGLRARTAGTAAVYVIVLECTVPGASAEAQPLSTFSVYFAGTSFSPWMWGRSFSFSLQYASRMSESGMSACVNLMVNGRVYITGSLKVISTSMCP